MTNSNSIRRRDFLKLLSFTPFLARRARMGKPLLKIRDASDGTDRPNILILVFDTFSARHASLYGYRRHTTPNLERFAEQATVYHNHISTANFTNPGTASLLTGTYPWTHRSMAIRTPVAPGFETRNLFSLVGSDYSRVAFSQNLFVVSMLSQMRNYIDKLIEFGSLSLVDWLFSEEIFAEDFDTAIWREIESHDCISTHVRPSSLIPGVIGSRIWRALEKHLNTQYRHVYPRGLPHHHQMIFLLEDALDWLIQNVEKLPQPYITYFHLYAPHYPYCPRSEFIDLFDDGWAPEPKPENQFTQNETQAELNEKRIEYDEYLAYADAEFGRLYDSLDTQGVLDNTVVVITSDHGELFERGIWRHSTEVLYEPVIHIPLLIRYPDQSGRRDVYEPTSSLDVVPTLCGVLGKPIPQWCEGRVLPGFREDTLEAESPRAIYSVDSKTAPRQGKLRQGTLSLRQGPYKLIHCISARSETFAFRRIALARHMR